MSELTKITKEEMAARITGREYPFRLSSDEKAIAKASGLAIVYGASDDLLEFEGAIDEELSAYNGTSATITDDGKIVESMTEGSDCDERSKCFFFKSWLERQKSFEVTSEWCPEGMNCNWNVTASKVPVATFEIKDDYSPDNIFCRGIVIDLNEVKSVLNA